MSLHFREILGAIFEWTAVLTWVLIITAALVAGMVYASGVIYVPVDSPLPDKAQHRLAGL